MKARHIAIGIVLGLVLHRAAAPLGVASLALGLGLGLNLLETALWPQRVKSLQRELEERTLRCFLVGLLTLECGLGLILASGPGLHGVLALALVLFLTGVALTGAPAALASLVGARLLPERSPQLQLAAGTVVAGVGGLVPVLGWLLALGMMIAGVGASILTVRAPRLVLPPPAALQGAPA